MKKKVLLITSLFACNSVNAHHGAVFEAAKILGTSVLYGAVASTVVCTLRFCAYKLAPDLPAVWINYKDKVIPAVIGGTAFLLYGIYGFFKYYGGANKENEPPLENVIRDIPGETGGQEEEPVDHIEDNANGTNVPPPAEEAPPAANIIINTPPPAEEAPVENTTWYRFREEHGTGVFDIANIPAYPDSNTVWLPNPEPLPLEIKNLVVSRDVGGFDFLASLPQPKTLERVIFEEDSIIKQIPDKTFQAYDRLTEIVLPQWLENIGRDAFQGCSSLVGISLPESLRFIDYNAFCDCSSLQSIVLSETCVDLRAGTFQGCQSLKSAEIKGRIECVYGLSFFANCSALENVNIANGTQQLFTGFFKNCTSLKKVHSNGRALDVALVTPYSFENCPSLEYLTLKNTTCILDGAFGDMRSTKPLHLDFFQCPRIDYLLKHYGTIPPAYLSKMFKDKSQDIPSYCTGYMVRIAENVVYVLVDTQNRIWEEANDDVFFRARTD